MTGDNIAPDWIDSSFFKKIIQNSHLVGQNCCGIKKFAIQSAANKGEHIGGNVLRARIEYTDLENKSKFLSLIIKYLGECKNGEDKKYEMDCLIFETELEMYSEIIPKFEKMLRNVGDKTELGPRLFYHSEEPHKIIVLEDLNEVGYISFINKMADASVAELAIDKLAKWHACSYKLNYENNGDLEDWNTSVFKTNENENIELMGGGVNNLIKVLKELPKEQQQISNLTEIIEMLEKIQGKVYKKCTNLYEFSKTQTKLNILNHGDFHCKNLMFKYDLKGSIEDVQIIDFALCFWGSMAFDLLYILYAIYDPELRTKNRDEIIYKYFKTFENCLISIGFKGKLPKLSDLLHDLMHLGHIEIWMATTFLPFIYGVTVKPNTNIEEFVNQKDSRLSMYRLPEYLKDIQMILKVTLNQGFLDESYYEE